MVQLAGRRAIVDSLTAASIDATGLAFVPIDTIPPRRIAMLRPSLRPGSAFTEAFCRILESQAKRLQADMTRRCASPRRVRAKR